MRIRKNALMLSLIASFLMAMAVVPSYAQTATLIVDADGFDEVIQDEIVTTDPFYIAIYVDDVEDMWGYHFKLYYDTSVLTATAFYSIAPFVEEQGPWVDEYLMPTGGWINDPEGYVEMAFSYPMGSTESLTTTDPVRIAEIDFEIDAPGASPLKIADSTLASIYEAEPLPWEAGIPHETIPAEFRTEAGLPVSQFFWIPDGDDPYVNEIVTFTSTATDDGIIVAWDWDFGDGTTATNNPVVDHTYTVVGDYDVTLTVTDNDGNTDTHTRKIIISSEPIVYGPVDLRNSHAAHRRFDVSVRDPETINQFTAWVKNLSPDQETFVRVTWVVTCEGVHLGEIPATGWVGPEDLAKFTGDFDVLDEQWEFEGERKDYDVWIWIWYADYWFPDPFDPSIEIPHFTAGTYSGVKTNWFRVTTLP